MVVLAEDDATRLRREREEAMERMLLAGEEADAAHHEQQHNHNENENDNNNDNTGNNEGDEMAMFEGAENNINDEQNNNNNNEMNDPIPPIHRGAVAPPSKRLSYTTTSFLLALGTLWYALRTREQWYLALVFLGSSKVAYCVLGNALVASAVVTFDWTTRLFLGGLRVMEAEGLNDFFRWNVTETCLALTMFRSEMTISVAIRFLMLVLVKCLHHVANLREQHLRMTDDAVRGSTWNPRFPIVPWHHCKVLIMLVVLQSVDLAAVQYTAQDLLTTGPSVSILFAFEAAILLVSAWSSILLWYIHVVDGLLNFWHDEQVSIGQMLLHPWKEYKATLTFAVELQAQAVQFLFYLTFFGFVMTYYGMPINLFREVYVSFMALKERLWAFLKYRRLMASMNRFDTPTEEQLEEAGRVCIICRDEMTLHDCKALPVCQHMFHKSCLREWLTQQQSCPTCRSDIASMEAQQAARNAAAAAANERQEGAAEEPAAEQQEGTQEQADHTQATPPPTPQGEEQPAVQDALRTNEKMRGMPKDENPSVTPAEPSTPFNSLGSPVSTKKVRFSANGMEPTLSFPALYRVVREGGTAVWNLDSAPPLLVRRLPLGVIVFGRDLQEHTVEGESENYVSIPDGWVADATVLRVFGDIAKSRQALSLAE